jgi:hypothetical protein
MSKTPEEIRNEELDQLSTVIVQFAEQYAKRWHGCMFALGGMTGAYAVQAAFLDGVDYGFDLKGEKKIELSKALEKATKDLKELKDDQNT